MARQRKLQGQLPMEFMLPETTWTPPTSLPDMTGEGDLAIDLETRDDGLANDRGPGWATRQGYVTGIVVTSQAQSVYCPVALPDTECVDHKTAGRWLEAHVRSPGRKYMQNPSYDIGWMGTEWGIEPPEELEVTDIMAFCLDENRLQYNLDSLCRTYEVPGKDETALRQAAEAFGYHPKKEMWKLPGRYSAPYAMQDGTATLQLGQRLRPIIEEQEMLAPYRLEADLVPMVVAMRRRGIRVDTNRAEEVMERLFRQRDEALRRLEDHVQIGRSLTIDDVRSSKWLASVFTDLSISYPKTDKGNDSFSNDWMKREDAGQVPNLVSRIRGLHDAAEKFVGNFILGHTHMGRIHADIHQYKGEDSGGTRTTRFSYSDPPLQQMTSRDGEFAKDIRAGLLPEEGEVWAAVDYSQQEFRLMVHFAALCRIEGADRPVSMYRADPRTDFHDLVASITGLPRRSAKDVNFAKAFGAGPPKFALMVGCSVDEARAQMAEYDREMPFLSRLSEFCQKRVDQRGYIRMIDGFRGHFDTWEPRWLDYERVRIAQADRRQRGLPEADMGPAPLKTAQARAHDQDHPWYGQRLRRAKTHKAMNTLIQGSAARQMKMAMRECWREGLVPLLQMHDELDFSVSSPDQAHRVAEIMANVIPLEIPMLCDVEFGANWGRAAADKKRGHGATWEEAIAELAGR